MELEALAEINEKRKQIRHILRPDDPADALVSYYAQWHDPRRTTLTLHRNAQDKVDGFVVVSQTGADLFRPLVTLRAPDRQTVGELLSAALTRNRPYQVIVPLELASAIRQFIEMGQATTNRIYRLDASRFQPVINVLVQQVEGADGSPRFQIESRGQVVAMSGTNWRSPTYAEVYVYVHPTGRGRGWGRSVVSACTTQVRDSGLKPLYMVAKENDASVRLAETLGYVDTGAREFVGEGKLGGMQGT